MWRRRRATVAGLTSPGDEDPTLGDLSLPDGRGGTAAREWTTRRENSRRLDTDPGCLTPAAFRARGRRFPGPGSDPAADAWCCRPACRPRASTRPCAPSATRPL